MFDVMIIEDDELVRKRLKRMIDWENVKVRLVCEAADGSTAKELYTIYRPQIIITDINIPMISGLDLMEELKSENPELIFIVITGYTDFELAKRSVSLHAFSMLSKPIRPEVMNECLEKAVLNLECERKKRQEQDSMKKLVEENLLQVQSYFMSELLRKEPADVDACKTKLKQLQIPCDGPDYLVVILSFYILDEKMSCREELLFFLKNMTDEYMKTSGIKEYTFIDSHFRVNCVLSICPEDTDNRIEEILLKISDQMSFVYDVNLYAGLGKRVDSIGLLYSSAQCALAALNYQSVMGKENIFHYKNMETIDSADAVKDSIHNHLIRQFLARNLEEVSRSLKNRVLMLQQDRENGRTLIRSFLFEYVTQILNEARHLGLDSEKIGKCVQMLTDLFAEENIAEKGLENALEITKELLVELNNMEITNSNYLIKKAKDYICINLSDKKLDLEKCSEHVALSKHYFCKLFHKSENMNFNTFLRQERVRKAKELLLTTELRIYEISEECGFSNANYFSYVFKQETGEKPLDYQKKHRK